MAYSTSGLIEATDYNNLTWGGVQGTYTASPNNLAYILGTGNGQFGYGQSVSSINTVAAAAVVTATQWSGLLTGVNGCLAHQSGSGAQLSIPTIVAGGTITYSSILNTAVTTINTNKALYTAQGTTTTGATFSPNFTSAATTAARVWTFTRTITFASANQARYFFNAGGQINFVTISATNGDATARSGDWVTLIATNLGSISAIRGLTNGGRSGTGGAVIIGWNTTSKGYWNTTTTPTNIVGLDSTTTSYTGDNIIVAIRHSAAVGPNGDNGQVVYLDFTVNSAASALPFNDSINVTWNHRIDIVYPETTYLTNTWGTATIT
jgi:hypothetical protein